MRWFTEYRGGAVRIVAAAIEHRVGRHRGPASREVELDVIPIGHREVVARVAEEEAGR